MPGIDEMEWSALWAMLGNCWRESTALANWCVQRCLRHDVMPLGVSKQDWPAFPVWPLSGPSQYDTGTHRGLYGCAVHEAGCSKHSFWSGAMSSVSTICQDVEKHWRRHRSAVLWRSDRSPPLFRYPFPFPVHAKSWQPLWNQGPIVVVSLPGGKRVALRLRAGPEFARQLSLFRKVVSGETKQRELKITRQRCSPGCHRPSMPERVPGGGQREHWRIMIRVPVTTDIAVRVSDRVLTLCTDPEYLWVAGLDGRKAWVLNADHIKKAMDWQNVHLTRLQRWSEDTKAERRASPRLLRQFEQSRQRCCDKHARRLHSWCQESAAHLVRFAQRQRVDEVLYDDRYQEYMPRFPWYQLRSALQHALDACGIRLMVSDEVSEVSDVSRSGEE